MQKQDFTKKLGQVYADILSIEIKESDSFESSMNKFYEVMRKWGICQGEWSENGRTINTPEWNMCFAVFKNHKIMTLDVFLVLNTPPDDLLAYGDRPVKY